jgi:hypothetical protein
MYKNISTRTAAFFFAGLAMILLVSCKKDGENLVLTQGAFSSNALSASAGQVTLTSNNDGDTVIHFQWPAVSYGTRVAVTYMLQIDKISDTSGAAGWSNARSLPAGNNILRYAFAGKDLNNLSNSMGLTPGAANPVAIRIISNINQYNGSGSTVPAVYSNTVVVNVTPYGLNLYVPGGYENWDPGSAPTIGPVDGRAGLYEGYVNITGSGIQYFKYTSAPDWNHINYGDGGNGSFSTDGAAAGLSVPNGGYYELTANLNNNSWTATATTWGIIGDATPGGWSNDTPMSYDATNQVWTVTANMVQAGSFKFRANNAWSIDFGVDNSGKLVYADNPFFGYTPGLNNLTVPSDGNYTIILDLHIPGKYTYQLNKN